MKPHRSSFDPTYIQWRAEFAAFRGEVLRGALRVCSRAHFDNLLDGYYWEGHESLNEFPAWAFERYLRETERAGAREDVP